MSLKAFHLVFIVCSILVVLGFAVWSLEQYLREGAGALYLIYGVGGLLTGGLLIRYSKFFLRKLKHISYL